MKQKILKLLLITLIITFAGLSKASAVHADSPQYKPTGIIQGISRHLVHTTNASATSTNWGGYAVESNLTSPQINSVNEASGQWIVPTLTCPLRSTSYSASWVGIDGYSDGTVEQTGTEQDCNRGKPQYYSWFELYPQYSYEVNLPVKPGNTVSADVKYVGNNSFTLTLINKTTNQTFTITKQAPGAERTSAEWIAEAPADFLGILPLANFGTDSFTNASVNMNGTVGTITNTNWQNQAINMVTSNGFQAKATTGPLSTTGSGFNVTWQHN